MPLKTIKAPVKTGSMKMKTPAGDRARKNYHLQTQSYNKKVGITPTKKKVPKPKR
tara:strand:+ start:54 stop:218 length:165 start_codon:yes stop_codon:yes gene_type:complete